MNGVFRTDYQITIGMNILNKVINIENYEIKLVIFDLSGSDRLGDRAKLFFKEAHGGVFIFDLTRRYTLESLDSSFNVHNHDVEPWLNLFKQGSEGKNENLPVLMVGNKVDLKENREISENDAKELAKKHHFFSYIESSAKTGNNIEEIFYTLAKMII